MLRKDKGQLPDNTTVDRRVTPAPLRLAEEIKVKNKKGFTIIELLVVIVIIFGFVPYVWNAIKLASCDFSSPYRCEIIHGIGVIVPPASLVTVWFADDGD